MNEELKKLRELVAASQEKVKTALATSTDENHKMMMNDMHDMMSQVMNYVFKAEDGLHRRIDNHQVGHLPQIRGAGKMQAALEALGIADDYNVDKPSISVSSSRYGTICNASYVKKENK